MSPLVRGTVAVMAGVMAAFLVIMLVQLLGAVLYPAPAGFDPKDPEALTALTASLPLGAFLMVLLGYLLGAVAGGYLAARLAPSRRAVHAGIVAAFLLAGSIMNLVSIPHPAWFLAANLLIVAVVPVLAGRLAQSRAVTDRGEV
jgi:hypothetical protein